MFAPVLYLERPVGSPENENLGDFDGDVIARIDVFYDALETGEALGRWFSIGLQGGAETRQQRCLERFLFQAHQHFGKQAELIGGGFHGAYHGAELEAFAVEEGSIDGQDDEQEIAQQGG